MIQKYGQEYVSIAFPEQLCFEADADAAIVEWWQIGYVKLAGLIMARG